jgi:ATP-dependent DNA helicase RecG
VQANARLQALVESQDGFHLAEVDLDIRGEGTIFDERQKGRSDLKLASLRRDREAVQQARDAAERIVDDDLHLDGHPELADELRLFLDPEDEAFLFKS